MTSEGRTNMLHTLRLLDARIAAAALVAFAFFAFLAPDAFADDNWH